MTKPLSLDLRQRVVDAINSGQSCRAAAARFGIAPSAAMKWHRLWRETGSVAPRRSPFLSHSAVEPALLAGALP